ncbi:CBS domain-containing protein [Candidatus Omnitrophota bacterium]
MIKLGIKKADEINRNVTEEDIVESHKVRDVMEEDFFVIKENNNLHQIIDVMKKTEDLNFPVVKMNEEFLGVISLGDLRDTFNEEQMDELILAGDIVREIGMIAYADQELQDIMKVFKTKNVDYVPVLASEKERRLVGQLEYRKLIDKITKEVILRQKELEG